MAEPHPEDERLMAYVDGELPAGEAEAVRRALETDAALAARVALFERTRDALRTSSGASIPPVTDSLLERVRAAGSAAARENVVTFARPAKAGSSRGWMPSAIAACLALVVGGALGFGLAERGPSQPVLGGPVSDPQWRSALDQLPSGESRDVEGGRLTAVSSFRDADGRLCREFGHRISTGRGSLAVLCRNDKDWRITFQMDVAAASDEDYRAASSHEALDAFLAATKAGAPLSKAEEGEALRAAR